LRRDGQLGTAAELQPSQRREGALAAALAAAVRFLEGEQRPDGHWCAELEGDSILESEYLLILRFLGRFGGSRTAKLAEGLRRGQLPDGGWALYPGGPADVSASTKAYFALKLCGDDPAAPHMERARRVILELGGVDACNSFTRLYLAIFGQYPWSRCPAVPPELVLMPRWMPITIYDMSAWSRTIVVPLSIIWAAKPRCSVPAGAGLQELWVEGARPRHPGVKGLKGKSWAAVFRLIDVLDHLAEALRLRPLRRLAMRRAERWMLDRLEKSDGLGAIFPPIINTVIALRCLGYADGDPVLEGQLRELERFEIEERGTMRVQPCFSPVWDTALALPALVEAGVPADDPALARAAAWLVEREVRLPGDWRVNNPGGPVGGWYFEYANEFYPDCDDTAQILTSLGALDLRDRELAAAVEEACGRARAWLLSMQNRDGGWGSFDRGCEREFLTFIPFADHNAMIDPSTSDITARAVQGLLAWGLPADHPAVAAGVGFLRRMQEEDGSWYGRWGCNYLYGTWLALEALAAAGTPPSDPAISRGAAWIRGCQNADGGWGELPASYSDPALKGIGPSTAAQTAWALLGLAAAGELRGEAAGRGAERLLVTQRADGGWRDEHWTGTGFPEVFYLRYHLYATYFPLRALAAYQRAGRDPEA
jgi:squalene-hopene/tetraprenyl-beta-curcumene cyclase